MMSLRLAARRSLFGDRRRAIFDIQAVRALLGGTRFAEMRLLAETGSTNDDIAPILAEGRARPYTILAEHQTHGRGRKEREWLDEAGTGILWTTSLPAIRVENLWAVTFWAALRVVDGILEAAKLAVSLQWPNDILLDGRKLAGILCVSQIRGREAFVGCGVGINFYRPLRALALERPAAYLNEYAVTTREQVLACILSSFEAAFEDLDSPATIARQWEKRARIQGTPYRILIDGEPEPIDATAMGLDEMGGLIVHTGREERVVRAGDARVLR